MNTTDEILKDIANSLRVLPELVEVFSGKNTSNGNSEGLSREDRAIALIFTMPSPTKDKIAKAVGYADHAGLRRMGKFRMAWKAYEILRTFSPGDYRVDGRRRKTKERNPDDGTGS